MAAARDPQGRCTDLAALEAEPSTAAMRSKVEKGKSKEKAEADALSGPPAPSAESSTLVEWRAWEAIRAWGRLSPPLAEVDLRPYLFVAKDRKDYFGATSVLGHLAGVAEKLMGPKLTVRGLEGELRQLAPPEAHRLFEVLRGRIVGADDFLSAPAGVEGLGVLVRSQPTLQSGLLDLLEALPNERCGPWPATGWDAAIKDTNEAKRYSKLLSTWASSAAPALKAAASAALRTRGTR